MKVTIETYARVMAELAASGGARAEVLARHGLDEAAWDEADTHWQARMSEALDEDEEGVPAVLEAYARAYQAAQRESVPLTLEQFAQVTRVFQATGDIGAAVARAGVTFADYVRGGEHYSRRIAEDPELHRRFEEALRAR